MKRLLPIYLLFISQLLPFVLQGQEYFIPEKRDHIWLTGKANGFGDPNFGGAKIDFNFTPPLVSPDERTLNFRENCAVICDPEGELLLYTNGEAIANFNHDIIENGDELNNTVPFGQRARLYQGSLFLNAPGDENLYYLFHEGEIYIGNNEISGFAVFNLYYSVVDMSMNGGEGAVIEKNSLIVQDTLDYGKITATRHANGRDWWIMVAKRESNAYYTLLLSPEGIEQMPLQHIGQYAHSGVGRACFSPDGTKYARHVGYLLSLGDETFLYDFDRCTGMLSNPRHQIFEPNRVVRGVAFSPNSRYLYLNNAIMVFQYDTFSENVFNTEDTVAVYDWTIPVVYDTRFYHSQLGPDNKIYFSGLGTHRYFHILHNPDEGGVSSNFEQNGLALTRLNWRTIPNNPNFRLGPLDGSPCDTLGLDNAPPDAVSTVGEERSLITCFPNPVSDLLTVEVDLIEDGQWDLYDALGTRVRQQKLDSWTKGFRVNVGDLPRGIYFYVLSSIGGDVLGEGKVIVL